MPRGRKGDSNRCSKHIHQKKPCHLDCPQKLFELNQEMADVVMNDSDDLESFWKAADTPLVEQNTPAFQQQVDEILNTISTPAQFLPYEPPRIQSISSASVYPPFPAPSNVVATVHREPGAVQTAPLSKEELKKLKKAEERRARSAAVRAAREAAVRSVDMEGTMPEIQSEGINLAVLNDRFELDALEKKTRIFDEIKNHFPDLGTCTGGGAAETYFERELKLVEFMNQWCGKLYGGKTPQVIMRVPKKDHYDYSILSYRDFESLFKGMNFDGLDKEDYAKTQYYLKHDRAEFKYDFPFTEDTEGNKVPAFQPKAKRMNVAKVYLEHPKAHVYNGLTFNPRPSDFKFAHKANNEFNTWTGFSLKREVVKHFKDWKCIRPILNHIRYTWANTEEEYINIMCRFALLMQEPWVKQQVGLIIAGKEGTGKSFIFERLIGIIVGDSHFAHVHSSSEVTGEFNAILAHKTVVFFDEAITGKSEKEMGMIKNLHTSKWQRMRAMYQDTQMIESYLNLFYATNELDEIMKLTKDSRRFMLIYSDIMALLNHPSYKCFNNDKDKYFDFIHHCLDDEKVIKTFANLLYNWPTDGFEYKTPKMTALMAQQIKKQLGPLESFWYDMIQNGVNYIADPKMRYYDKTFERIVTSDHYWDFFQKWCQINKIEKIPFTTKSAFVNHFLQLLPEEVKENSGTGSVHTFTFGQSMGDSANPVQNCLDYLYLKNPALKIDDENQGDVDNIKKVRMEKLEKENLWTNAWPEYENLHRTNGPRVPEHFEYTDKEKLACLNGDFDDIKEIVNQD
jgi:hypothetical protein